MMVPSSIFFELLCYQSSSKHVLLSINQTEFSITKAPQYYYHYSAQNTLSHTGQEDRTRGATRRISTARKGHGFSGAIHTLRPSLLFLSFKPNQLYLSSAIKLEEIGKWTSNRFQSSLVLQ